MDPFDDPLAAPATYGEHHNAYGEASASQSDAPEDAYAAYPSVGEQDDQDAYAYASAPPLYPAVTSAEESVTQHLFDSSMAASAPLAEPHSAAMVVTITEPRQAQESATVPGMSARYITYLVSTRSASAPSSSTEIQVRRRFSDFVALANLLEVTHRGYFVPPRPQKYVARGNKLSAKFVDKRRGALQQYMKRLANHRAIGRSEELRTFLESPEELRGSAAWASLHPPAPTWIDGARRLLSQLIGRERMVPVPSAAAQSTRHSNDLMRHMRERLYVMRSSDSGSMPDPERALRQQSDTVRELATTVIGASSAAVAQHRALIYSVKATNELGYVLGQLGQFEESQMNTIMGQAQKALGHGCRSLHALGAKATAVLGSHVRVLEEHARLMGGVLQGLHAREEALVTVDTLAQDIEVKRDRAQEASRAGRSQRATRVMGEVAAAEAARAAARSEYDRVAARNSDELQHFAQDQSQEVLLAMYAWAGVQQAYTQRQLDTWVNLATELGADRISIAHLQQP